jgi:hypothetical protein
MNRYIVKVGSLVVENVYWIADANSIMLTAAEGKAEVYSKLKDAWRTALWLRDCGLDAKVWSVSLVVTEEVHPVLEGVPANV